MKKCSYMIGVVGLLLAGLLILGGCDNPSEGGSSLKGVFGDVNGVVFDTSTLTPLSGVTVEVGGKKGSTDSNGSFFIRDVEIGNHIVSFNKDGYRFTTRHIEVAANKYINDDPFNELNAMTQQFVALQEWVKAQNLFSATGAQTLTYTEGVWTFGDGSVVTIENDEFVIKDYKLDYKYNYGVPTYITGLAPMNGALKGNVKLVLGTQALSVNDVLGNIVDMPRDIAMWFVEGSASSAIGGLPQAGTVTPGTAVNASGDVFYGPLPTGANGTFQMNKLPSSTALNLVFNAFTYQGFIFTGSNVTRWNGTGSNDDFEDISATGFAANPSPDGRTYTDVGTIYIFADPNFIAITEFSTGTNEAPLARDGEITLKFGEAISHVGFTAGLYREADTNHNASTVGGATISADHMKLEPTWSADGKTITLKAPYLLPMSVDSTLPVGRLVVNGAGLSGNKIYSADVPAGGDEYSQYGLPVYTVEALKITNVEVASGAPTRAAVLTGQEIKITFNKEIADIGTFQWTATTGSDRYGYADWKFGADQKTVWVYTDLLVQNVNRTLQISVKAKADADETLTGSISNASNGNIYFTKTREYNEINLKSTNLYQYRDADKPFGANNANYRVGNLTESKSPAITLTFHDTIPAGAKLYARLTKATSGTISDFVTTGTNTDIVVTVSGAGTDTMTIAPQERLEKDSPYNLLVKINMEFDNGQYTIFGGVNGYSDTLSNLQQYADVNILALSGNTFSDGGTNIKAIQFNTVDNTAIVKNRILKTSMQGDFTTSQFTVSGTAITAGNAVTGRAYYITLENDLMANAFGLSGTAWKTYKTTDDPDFKIQLSKIANRVLAFRVVDDRTDKTLALPGTPITLQCDEEGTATNGTDKGSFYPNTTTDDGRLYITVTPIAP